MTPHNPRFPPSPSTRAEPQVLSQALDELAHLVLSGREIEYSDAVQSWYRRGYRCADIPAPNDATLSRFAIERALHRLGDLLKERNRTIQLVAAGGVISVMQFGNRLMTRDVDVVMPPQAGVELPGETTGADVVE